MLLNNQNKILKAAYKPGGEVALFVNTGSGTVQMEKIVTLFERTTEKPTEVTIGYWGRKLVAVARQNSGNMVARETTDLTGRSGWSEIIDLGVKADAPCILTYTEEDKPLLITASMRQDGYHRMPLVKVVPDIRYAQYSKVIFLDYLVGRGGYNSLVPNRNGYGIMYYNDNYTGDRTYVYYKEANLESLGKETQQFYMLNEPTKELKQENGEWDITLGNVNNFTFSTVSKGLYTKTGNLIYGNFGINDVQPTAGGVISFTFNLPFNRKGATLSGNCHLGHANRDSSSYVTNYASNNYTEGFVALKASTTGTGGLYVSFSYRV